MDLVHSRYEHRLADSAVASRRAVIRLCDIVWCRPSELADYMPNGVFTPVMDYDHE